jgi:hypothetical protein
MKPTVYKLTIGYSPDNGPAHPHDIDFEVSYPTRAAADRAALEQNGGTPVQWRPTEHEAIHRAQLSSKRVAEIEKSHGPASVYVRFSTL